MNGEKKKKIIKIFLFVDALIRRFINITIINDIKWSNSRRGKAVTNDYFSGLSFYFDIFLPGVCPVHGKHWRCARKVQQKVFQLTCICEP